MKNIINFIIPLTVVFLTGCQFYVDPRTEPLVLMTENEISKMNSELQKVKDDLETEKEMNFELETKPKQPPIAIPGSEEIGFIDATTARLYGCRALTNLKMVFEGIYDHGVIAVKNRAFSLGADMMVAGKMGEYKLSSGPKNEVISQFSVELYRCPDSAFEEGENG